MDTDLLALPPWNLPPEDIAWVRRTRDALSTEEKVRQLFVLAHFRDLPDEVPAVMATRPGGVHRAWGGDARLAWQTTRAVLEQSEIPPFITGDLEGGAYGSPSGSPLPNPMGVAAMGNLALSREVARTLAEESRAMGFDWSFTPVIDINHRVDSPIVGTRSYGSDPDTVLAQALVHVQEMQARGIACTAKHWPGEGYDARDQHLLTTVNPLGWDEWMATFGRLYRSLIEAGVLSVMSAHIALPQLARRLVPGAGERAAYMPASISHALNTRLLRDELGFNGLVISDATPMAGLTTWADRAEWVPQVIESGCDVFLFSHDAAGDLALMLQGLREGRLSEARVEAAVTRVLALKARLGLHRRGIDERLRPLDEVLQRLRRPAAMDIAERAAAASVTLVKDLGVLPMDPRRHRRVVVVSPGIESHWVDTRPRPLQVLQDGLAARGFELRPLDPAHWPTPADTDLVLYLLAKESMLSRGRVFLDWIQLHGDPRKAMHRFWPRIPTVLVSFGHAAYLLDAPRMPVCINAYTSTEPAQRAVLSRLLGEEPCTGTSPIDAFCGQPEARW